MEICRRIEKTHRKHVNILKMRSLVLFILLVVLFGGLSMAQTAIDSTTWAETMRDIDYTETGERNKKRDDLKQPLNFGEGLPELGTFLAYVVVVFLAVFLAYVLLKNYRPDNKLTESSLSGLANEDTIELDKLRGLVDKAIRSLDYITALRYVYLLTVRRLAEEGAIKFVKGKTNGEYLDEVKLQKEDKISFRDIANIFDSVRYGQRMPTKSDFERFRSRCNSIVSI
jgi:hypothetical protein